MKPHIYLSNYYLLHTSFFKVIKENSNNPTSYEHLGWMLRQIIEDNMSDTKACRWLGYVYGCMYFKDNFNPLTSDFLEHFSYFDNVAYPLEPDDYNSPCIELCNQYLFSIPEFKVRNDLSFKSIDNAELAWILEDITKKEKSELKSNFLLGYVQGIMTNKNMLNVDKERDRTRNLFNGT